MQRTVGFTMSIGAQLILNKTLNHLGLVNPLMVPLSKVKKELSQRGIVITKNMQSLD
jgi:lysine 6-dehydrogenase